MVERMTGGTSDGGSVVERMTGGRSDVVAQW